MFQSKDGLEKHLEHNTEVFKDKRVKAAFQAVDRKGFVIPDLAEEAYEDYPLPIGEGQTISQPTTVAFMLELLGVQEGEKVLDVGTGSGWTTALLSHMVGEKGEVYGVERVPELVQFGLKNIKAHGCINAEIFQVEEGVYGLPKHAPFDKILVSAAAESDTAAEELLDQLADNSAMVIPIQDTIVQFRKEDGEVKKKGFPGFVFVPLISE